MIQLNALLFIFLALYLLQSSIQAYLHRLNLSYLRRNGNDVPELLRDIIDGEKFKKISAYTVESDQFSMMATLFDQGVSLAILFVWPSALAGEPHPLMGLWSDHRRIGFFCHPFGRDPFVPSSFWAL